MNYPEKDYLITRKKALAFPFAILTVIFSVIYLVLYKNNSSYAIYNIRFVMITLAIISFLLACFFSYNIFFNTRQRWYYGALTGMIYMNLFSTEIFEPANYSVLNNFIFIVLEFAYIIIFLWISKNNFGKVFHTFNIVVLSTYSLFILSVVFSSYYYEAFNVVSNFDSSNFFSLYFSTCKVSMRYFFEFPPDEYLDMVTIFQFIIGKIYEAVLIGGIASMVVRTVGNSEND